MNSPPPRLSSFRLLWGSLIVLVILNVSLLAWLWLAPARMPGGWHPRGGPGPEGAESFLAERLHFTPAQRTRFDSLRAMYFRQMRPLMERAHTNRLNYFQLLDDTTLTDQQLAQRAAVGHAAMTQVDVLTLRHFQQIAALCTPAQRQQLTQVLAELPMLRGGGGPPGRREGMPRPGWRSGRRGHGGPGTPSGPPPF
ncbi:periplasmic heavy metal sensor [Hymenobacter sp. BT507]|uniref:Periplasmic heavy metal sensor n=1 Tax=Hymenobacter citatus TaxID=2763506 RepID=A0ABR7ML42_9BACT|nr:periplasmic heavy metal sensor [Hymenobacter citatus]MBC6611760.1 periplasmic heavy metal sensor [Hymenobacter citatus]